MKMSSSSNIFFGIVTIIMSGVVLFLGLAKPVFVTETTETYRVFYGASAVLFFMGLRFLLSGYFKQDEMDEELDARLESIPFADGTVIKKDELPREEMTLEERMEARKKRVARAKAQGKL